MSTVFDELREAKTVDQAIAAARKCWPDSPPRLIMISVSLYTIWPIWTIERYLYSTGQIKWHDGDHAWNK